MAVGDRARRLLPAVPALLALLFGLCAVVPRTALSSGGPGWAGSPRVSATVTVADLHATRPEPGPRPRLSEHRQTGKAPLTAAAPMAVPDGGVPFRRWPGPRRAQIEPPVSGRFTWDGRAPPEPASVPA